MENKLKFTVTSLEQVRQLESLFINDMEKYLEISLENLENYKKLKEYKNVFSGILNNHDSMKNGFISLTFPVVDETYTKILKPYLKMQKIELENSKDEGLKNSEMTEKIEVSVKNPELTVDLDFLNDVPVMTFCDEKGVTIFSILFKEGSVFLITKNENGNVEHDLRSLESVKRELYRIIKKNFHSNLTSYDSVISFHTTIKETDFYINLSLDMSTPIFSFLDKDLKVIKNIKFQYDPFHIQGFPMVWSGKKENRYDLEYLCDFKSLYDFMCGFYVELGIEKHD